MACLLEWQKCNSSDCFTGMGVKILQWEWGMDPFQMQLYLFILFKGISIEKNIYLWISCPAVGK